MLQIIPQFIRTISLGRFLVSLSLAVIVWGYVIATQNPERTLPPFELVVPEPQPANNLELVPLPNQTRTVRVTISGQASRVETITASQLKPYVDVQEFTQPGNYDVPVKLRPDLLPQDISYNLEPKTIPIRLEQKISKQIPVEVLREGEVNPDYFLEGEIQASPNQVTIQGRQSLVDQVARAQVPISLNGRVGTLRDTRQVQLADARGQRLADTGLSVSPASVTVTAVINSRLATRTVPIRVITRGEPANGFIAGAARADPTLATLTSGNIDLLNQINFVETEPVNISGASSEVADSVQLLKIPNVTFLGNDRVQVKIGIVPFQATKTISLPLEVQNQASNLRYAFNPQTVNLTISGPFQAFLPELPLDKIKAIVDLQGRSVGNHLIPVQVELPSDLVVTNVPTVSVTITRPVPVLVTPSPTPTRTPTPTSAPTATVPATSTAGITATATTVTTASITGGPAPTTTRSARPAGPPTVAAIGANQLPASPTPEVSPAPPDSPAALEPVPRKTAPPVQPTAAR